jgi:hypothetical protein
MMSVTDFEPLMETSGMPQSVFLILAQERLDVLSQFALHIRFGLFEAICVNRDRCSRMR